MSEAHEIPALAWDMADRLRKALRFAGLSVGEMSDYLGVSRNTVGRYINGHVSPDRRTLRLWALRCGVPMDWLLGDAHRRPVADGDWGPPLLTNADIPSGITDDLTGPPTQDEILAFRKRVPLSRLTDPAIIRTAGTGS